MPAAISTRRSAGRKRKQVAQQGAETGPDLGDRPLAAARSARAEGKRAGDDLHQGNARTNLSLVIVIGGNHRIRAMSLGLGGKGEDDYAAQQARRSSGPPAAARETTGARPRGARTSRPRRPDAAPGSSRRQPPARSVPQRGWRSRRRSRRAPRRRPPRPPTQEAESAAKAVLTQLHDPREENRKSRWRREDEADEMP